MISLEYSENDSRQEKIKSKNKADSVIDKIVLGLKNSAMAIKSRNRVALPVRRPIHGENEINV